MSLPPERGPGNPRAVLHTTEAAAKHRPAPADSPPSCVRCGGALRLGAAGRPRRGTRYCTAACRQTATRDRRAAAHADLLANVCKLVEVAARIEADLRTMGLNPTRPRSRGQQRRS